MSTSSLNFRSRRMKRMICSLIQARRRDEASAAAPPIGRTIGSGFLALIPLTSELTIENMMFPTNWSAISVAPSSAPGKSPR